MADIRVMFVLPDEGDDETQSPLMMQAFDSCKQIINNTSWIKESEIADLTLSKKDYLVYENLDGKDFSTLLEKKCAVLGPLAISVCLMEGKPIPSFQYPFLNVAMYDCVVACTKIVKAEKEEIKRKIQLMGGFYVPDFSEGVTHLVVGACRSEKYTNAVAQGTKLMLPEWVQYSFQESIKSNFNATAPKILEKFKCPVFQGLIICSTGISSSKDREKLGKIIVANGGVLAQKLVLSKTDYLICHGAGGTSSDKYKAARRCSQITCVTLDWIYDSIKKGHLAPADEYRPKAVTSTPTKDCENADPNFSTISEIGGSSIFLKPQIDETVNVTCMTTNGDMRAAVGHSNKRKADEDLVDKIDIKKVKSAGSFLDGCSVFVAGFNPTQKEKLNKIINISGATRYDVLSERVTHVIVGDPNSPEVTSIKSKGGYCLVTVQWLLKSVEQQGPADESKFLITKCEEPKRLEVDSPLSKRMLSLLKENTEQAFTEENDREHPAEEDKLTQQYLKKSKQNVNEEEDTLARLLGDQELEQPGNSKDEFVLKTRPLHRTKETSPKPAIDFNPPDTSTQLSEESTLECPPIFQSLKFVLDDFEEEDLITYIKLIEFAHGTVVDKQFKGICDYAIVPIEGTSVKMPPAKEIVNTFWLLHCFHHKELLKDSDIPYYFRPLEPPTSSTVLKGCVIAVSGYNSEEREYLILVIKLLGGIYQDLLSRKCNEARNVLATTHLVSLSPSGKKYEAAIKWGLPVVTKDWLLECLKTDHIVSVNRFAVSAEDSSSVTICDKSKDGDKKQPGTPKNENIKSADLKNRTPKTPLNKKLNISDERFSQVTPINKILQDAINNKVLPTPPSPETYYPWNPKTPDTPLGAFINENPSPGLKKEMHRYINSFPDFVPPKRRMSTPLSELRRRLVNKCLGIGESSQAIDPGNKPLETQDLPAEDNNKDLPLTPNQKNIENKEVHKKLQELQERVLASGSSSASRRSSKIHHASSNLPSIEKTNIEVQSQVCTVGWDYEEEKTHCPKDKIFMLSGMSFDQRELLASNLKKLGASVSEAANYDPTATHLICVKPSRNEKTLACMAAGKWILHVSYVEKCMAAGRFIDEEEFEFGNPKARNNVQFEEKDNCIHLWRKEISRRGYGAFNDMRAIVMTDRKAAIANVIEAGGGLVVNVEPPFEDSIHATHCLLDPKNIDLSKYEVLAQQGIKCVNTLYIHNFLLRNKIDDNIIPQFLKYY
ncbi:DNA topoisomerase 2-binding protein 1 [Anthonomus grandis grandis]|uniref:DNA topoisomerase 2-binding protein 1 n=1 Tax=Anthonomus grandis grandis TaxID=2921223 RepID=UPI0021656ACD|nr:DNA topoisomerase 2-binding protein 1 [Anthonomus grandis grandis]XP_050310489.1 DNA topoisomerase 2-binding protein 1 [Anthonomus grandis grandis]